MLLGAALLVCFTPLGFFILVPLGQSWCEFRNSWEYRLHRERYESIVLALAAQKLRPGRPHCFSLSPDKDPASLKPADPERDEALFNPENETRIVEVRVHPDGRLVVRLCTYSMGHAGVYGLVYSSGPPDPGEIENSFGMDGRIAPVAPHWWRVSDYSQ